MRAELSVVKVEQWEGLGWDSQAKRGRLVSGLGRPWLPAHVISITPHVMQPVLCQEASLGPTQLPNRQMVLPILSWGEWVRLPGRLEEGSRGSREAPLSVAGGANQDGDGRGPGAGHRVPNSPPHKDTCQGERKPRMRRSCRRNGCCRVTGLAASPRIQPHSKDRPERR